MQNKEYYLKHTFETNDMDEARQFVKQVCIEHKLNFDIYSEEGSDIKNIRFSDKPRGILLPAIAMLIGMWLITQFEIWTLGEVIR